MIRMLQKHGNSQALVIDKPLMEALGIAMDTPLSVTVNGNTLTIQAANVGIGPERVDALMAQVEARYGRALTRLAE